MKSEWKRVRIADVADVRRGASPRPIHNFLSDEGMPWVKIADATSKNSRYIAKTKEFIKESGVSASVVVVPETLILSNSATPGLPRIMKIQACVHDGWLVFGNYRNVERDFLYYLLTYVRPNLIGLANGSVFQNLKTDIVNQFEISLPPLSYQRKVAAILSSLDDKIENNNAICKNLEEQAAALYKSWFVDFEPFGGVMPDGWKYNTLSHMSNIKSGKRPIVQKKLKSNSETVPVLGASGVNGYSPLAMYEHPVLVTGRVGTHGVIQRWESPCWPSDNTLVIETHNYEYVYQVLDNIDYSILNRGSTQPLITQHDLGNVSIVVPSSQWLQKYERRAGELMNLSNVLLKENEVLATLRDSLLPKLMSGEIDVDEVAI